MKLLLPTTTLFLGSAAASSWIFYQCTEATNFCLEGDPNCVYDASYWIQWSEPNGGGNIEKKGAAQDPKTGDSWPCPVNGALSVDHTDGDFMLQVIYKDFDPNAPSGGDVPTSGVCAEGELFEPDGTTSLGKNDGSGVLPPHSDGSGWCSSSVSCDCEPYIVVNSP